MSNRHPVKRLRAPDGSRADIDMLLVPLIKALWAAGYETVGSCQDLGESIGEHAPRKSAYWSGYVLLEMPVEDTLRLLDMVRYTPQFEEKMHWAASGAWEVSLPVTTFDDEDAAIDPWTQIHFPGDQISDLVEVLTGA